jgi:hypothetical protein
MLSADGTYNYHGFKCLSEQGQGKEICIVPEIWNQKNIPNPFFTLLFYSQKMGLYNKKRRK